MLVLSRKRNERIIINGDIIVEVLEIRGDKVRLGVEAPREIGVHREEVQKQIQIQKEEEEEKGKKEGAGT